MIIRKPFAFIVEKFKLLHLLILIPAIYLTYMFWNLQDFFNSFVVSGYVTSQVNVVGKYYSILMLISALIIIAFSTIIITLFRKKNKSSKMYEIVTIFYSVILLFTIMLPSFLSKAQIGELESSTSLIVRGASSISFWGLIISLIVILLLGFGFDFFTGEFLEIKDEINLDEEDSEEVEINIKRDDYKLKRGIRRYFREIKYYIIENKNIFKVLAGIVGFIILIIVARFVISLNRIVRIDQNFNYSFFNLQFNDSYLTSLDYSGNYILKDKIYLATKIKVRNSTNDLLALNTSDFCLYIEDECFYPTLDRSGKFLDIAKPYYGEAIGSNQEYEYVFAYELDEFYARGSYKIRILDSLTKKNDILIPKYKEINLSPSYSDVVSDVATYHIGDEIDLSGTTLLNTKLKINDVKFTNNYKYSYEYCYQDNCYESYNNVNPSLGKFLVVLNDELTLDETSSYSKYKLGSNNFYADFMKIEYTANGNKYYSDLVDKTPKDSKNAVLEVNSNVSLADSINLIITIRDKRYTVILKE